MRSLSRNSKYQYSDNWSLETHNNYCFTANRKPLQSYKHLSRAAQELDIHQAHLNVQRVHMRKGQDLMLVL